MHTSLLPWFKSILLTALPSLIFRSQFFKFTFQLLFIFFEFLYTDVVDYFVSLYLWNFGSFKPLKFWGQWKLHVVHHIIVQEIVGIDQPSCRYQWFLCYCEYWRCIIFLDAQLELDEVLCFSRLNKTICMKLLYFSCFVVSVFKTYLGFDHCHVG